MTYTDPLPPTEDIKQLAKVAGPFPTTAGAVRSAARKQGLDMDTIHFLELFPKGVVFESPEDFSTRSEELLFLLQEEQSTTEAEN